MKAALLKFQKRKNLWFELPEEEEASFYPHPLANIDDVSLFGRFVRIYEDQLGKIPIPINKALLVALCSDDDRKVLEQLHPELYQTFYKNEQSLVGKMYAIPGYPEIPLSLQGRTIEASNLKRLSKRQPK